jgi:hypothetical protein
MYDSAVWRIRVAAADGGGDGGMRRRDGLGRPVLVVVDAGIVASTLARTDSGDTPSVPVAQPVRSTDAAAIAPTRAGEGVIMPSPEGRFRAFRGERPQAIAAQHVAIAERSNVRPMASTDSDSPTHS